MGPYNSTLEQFGDAPTLHPLSGCALARVMFEGAMLGEVDCLRAQMQPETVRIEMFESPELWENVGCLLHRCKVHFE